MCLNGQIPIATLTFCGGYNSRKGWTKAVLIPTFLKRDVQQYSLDCDCPTSTDFYPTLPFRNFDLHFAFIVSTLHHLSVLGFIPNLIQFFIITQTYYNMNTLNSAYLVV